MVNVRGHKRRYNSGKWKSGAITIMQDRKHRPTSYHFVKNDISYTHIFLEISDEWFKVILRKDTKTMFGLPRVIDYGYGKNIEHNMDKATKIAKQWMKSHPYG